MRTQNWKQFTPFIFYTATATILGIAAATSEVRSSVNIMLLLVGGLVSWTIIEYFLHRFAFHHSAPPHSISRRLLSASHQKHHDHPQAVDQLFASLRMSVPIALSYYLLTWLIIGDWRATSYLFIGLVCGYFSYEWLHYQAHHGAPRLRPLKYLRTYHLLHHHRTPDLRFGVTSPVIDYLCGTFRAIDRGRPGSQARR